MLVNTMNPTEVTSEILEDYEAVKKSYERLIKEYDKERKRFKIDKNVAYNKWYEIKSKKKNTWLFILQKAPTLEKYKGIDSINVGAFIYYYHLKGLRVFTFTMQGDIYVYKGHLFTRYNERMGLGIEKPLDMVRSFLNKNGYSIGRAINKNERNFLISTCKEGLLLGEIQEQGKWFVFKTFITKELKKDDQDEIEQELIDCLESEIEKEISEGDYDKEEFLYNSDILKSIK